MSNSRMRLKIPELFWLNLIKTSTIGAFKLKFLAIFDDYNWAGGPKKIMNWLTYLHLGECDIASSRRAIAGALCVRVPKEI